MNAAVSTGRTRNAGRVAGLLAALLLTAGAARAVDELRVEPVMPPHWWVDSFLSYTCGTWPFAADGQDFTVSEVTRVTALGAWVAPMAEGLNWNYCCKPGSWRYSLVEYRSDDPSYSAMVGYTATFGPLPCTSNVRYYQLPGVGWPCQTSGVSYRRRSIVGGCAVLRPPPYYYKFRISTSYLHHPDGRIDTSCYGIAFGTSGVPNPNPSPRFSHPALAAYDVITSNCTHCETCCDDGIDNDGDGLVDCEDDDCSVNYHGCLPENLAAEPEDEPCANGFDDDGDGDIDCEDTDCQDETACLGPEICDDGTDNNANGLADCDDPGCFGDPACPEICNDELDNEGDGLIDCDDDDCIGSIHCGEACADGIDNDGDGLVDCFDIEDCQDDPACDAFEYLCEDLEDDDGDGLIDCADPDCQTREPCSLPEEEPAEENGPGDDCAGEIAIPDTCPPWEDRGTVAWDPLLTGSPTILPHSGQESFEALDYFSKGRDPVVDVRILRRHLTRVTAERSPFGDSWFLNYRQFLRPRPDGSFVHDAFGTKDRFRKRDDFRWEGTTGRFDVIVRTQPHELTMRMRGGTRLVFTFDDASPSSIGRLTRVISSKGNELEITWEGSGSRSEVTARRILLLRDSFGRPLTFRYIASDSDLLGEIEDWSGRVVKYTYEEGRLATVRSPTVRSTGGLNDFPLGRTTRYEYRGATDDAELDELISDALVAVIAPSEIEGIGIGGAPRFTWTYEESETAGRQRGWVRTHVAGNTSSSLGERAGGGEYAFSYAPRSGAGGIVMETSVVNRRGTRTNFLLNRKGQKLSQDVSQTRRPGLPATLSSTWTYDAEGSVLEEVKPLGNSKSHQRTAAVTDHRGTHGNRMSSRTSGDGVRVADHGPIDERIVFEPIFNHRFKVTNPRDADSPVADAFTTTYYYDYMEDLDGATEYFAAQMGIEELDLARMLAEAGIRDLNADVNGDGRRDQWTGQLIRIEHPEVTEPERQAAVETFAYNEFGQLTRHVDAEGNVTTHEYYGANDPAGLGGAPSADGGGYLRRTVRDAESSPDRQGGANPPPVRQATTYEYRAQQGGNFPANRHGVPTAIIDARGIKHVFLVNELDEIVQTVSAADVSACPEPDLVAFSLVETLIRDANGNVKRREFENRDGLDGGSDPFVTEYSHDILDRVIRRVDDATGAAIVTTFAYDPSGNLRQRVSAKGTDVELIETWTHDDLNQVIEHAMRRSPTEIARVVRDVDANGNVVRIYDPDNPPSSVASQPTVIEHDAFDRVRSVTDRMGAERRLRLDRASNILEESRFGGLVPGGRAELLARTTWEYDERNRPFREDRHLFFYPGQEVGVLDDGALQPGDGRVTTLTKRDRLGRPVLVTDADGEQVTQAHDGLSRTIFVRDPIGNEAHLTHDAMGNVIRERRVERATLGSLAEEFTTRRTFDALGRQVTLTEPNGQLTRTWHDSRGLVTRTKDALGNEVEYRHDGLGRLVDTRTYLSDRGTDASATNRDMTQGGGDGMIRIASSWDPLGRLSTQTDDRGNLTRYSHDPIGGISRIDFADGTHEERTYSLGGKPLTVRKQDGTLQRFETDAEGRVTGLIVDGPPFMPGGLVRRWDHDGLGRVVRDFDDNGALEDVTVEYAHDSLSRRLRERQHVQGWPSVDVETWPAGAGRLVRQVQPSGRHLVFKHHANGQLLRIQDASGGAPIAQYDWIGTRKLRVEYGNGQIMDRRDPVTGSSIAGTESGYDLNGRPTRTNWGKPGEFVTARWTNTWNGPSGIGTNRRIREARLMPGRNVESITEWTQDSASRQVTFMAGGVASSRDLDGANKSTWLREGGLLHSLVVDGDPSEAGLNQYSAINGVTRTYAETGELLNDGARTMTWDPTDRLVDIVGAGGALVTRHVRSADGRVMLRRTGGEVIRHVYSGWQEVEERDAAGVLREHVTGPGIDEHVQLRVPATGETYYLHASDLGSVLLMTDALGLPVETYDYEWFGRPVVLDLSDLNRDLDRSPRGNPHLFQGRRWDADAALYDFRNRHYDPQWGEFVSVDPLGIWAHGVGTGYEAFGGDPWNRVDPMGLAPSWLVPFPSLAGKWDRLAGVGGALVGKLAPAPGPTYGAHGPDGGVPVASGPQDSVRRAVDQAIGAVIGMPAAVGAHATGASPLLAQGLKQGAMSDEQYYDAFADLLLLTADVEGALGLGGALGSMGRTRAVADTLDDPLALWSKYRDRHCPPTELRMERAGAVPVERTLEHALDPAAYAHAVAEHYGINLSGAGQSIALVLDETLPVGTYGLTKASEGGRIVRLGPSAFVDEATLANTIAHELSHARDYLRGAHKPHGAVYDAGNALEAWIRGER